MKNSILACIVLGCITLVSCGKDELAVSDVSDDDAVEFVQPEIIVEEQEPEIIVEMDTFASPDVDISFDYRVSPDGYTLNASQEQDAYGILLMRTDDLLAMQDLEGTEGPGGINIIVFSNTDSLSPIEWAMINVQYSNFVEGTDWQAYTIAGNEGIRYNWEGLYPGESIVFTTATSVYIFSLTTNTNIESMKADFGQVLKSVELE